MKQTVNHDLIRQGLKILKKDPSSLVFAPLADLFRKEGNYKTAIKISQYGIKKHPKFATGYTVLGRTLFECGEYEKAVSNFEKAIELNPENILALRYLGKIYLHLKDTKKILKVCEMVLLHFPHDEWAQDMTKQLRLSPEGHYDHFNAQTLKQVSKNLSLLELEKKPLIHPKTTASISLKSNDSKDISKEDLSI